MQYGVRQTPRATEKAYGQAEKLRQLRKTPVEKFTDLKSIEMAIEALEAAQERAQEEITARAIKIQALREQGERLQQKTAMDQTEAES